MKALSAFWFLNASQINYNSPCPCIEFIYLFNSKIFIELNGRCIIVHCLISIYPEEIYKPLLSILLSDSSIMLKIARYIPYFHAFLLVLCLVNIPYLFIAVVIPIESLFGRFHGDQFLMLSEEEQIQTVYPQCFNTSNKLILGL